MSPRAWKQKKPTPPDRGPPLHVNRPQVLSYTQLCFVKSILSISCHASNWVPRIPYPEYLNFSFSKFVFSILTIVSSRWLPNTLTSPCPTDAATSNKVTAWLTTSSEANNFRPMSSLFDHHTTSRKPSWPRLCHLGWSVTSYKLNTMLKD